MNFSHAKICSCDIYRTFHRAAVFATQERDSAAQPTVLQEIDDNCVKRSVKRGGGSVAANRTIRHYIGFNVRAMGLCLRVYSNIYII